MPFTVQAIPLYKLNPDDYAHDPTRQSQIKRAIRSYQNRQFKNKTIISQGQEIEELRSQNAALKEKIVELRGCCEKNGQVNIDIVDKVIPPAKYSEQLFPRHFKWPGLESLESREETPAKESATCDVMSPQTAVPTASKLELMKKASSAQGEGRRLRVLKLKGNCSVGNRKSVGGRIETTAPKPDGDVVTSELECLDEKTKKGREMEGMRLEDKFKEFDRDDEEEQVDIVASFSPQQTQREGEDGNKIKADLEKRYPHIIFEEVD